MSKIKEIVVVKNEGSFVSYESVSLENYQGAYGEKGLTHSFLMDTLRKLMGRTLTIIDASISDKQQNKAIKDIVRNMFSDEMEFSAGWVYDQDKMVKEVEEHFKDMSDEEIENSSVSVEEALGVDRG